MRVEVLMVANQASLENGLLSVSGGGWESLTPQIFPTTISPVLVGIVAAEEDEIGSDPLLHLVVKDQDGHVRGAQGSIIISGARQRTPGVPYRTPFVVPLVAAVLRPTVVTIDVLQGETVLASVDFAVLGSIPDAPLA